MTPQEPAMGVSDEMIAAAASAYNSAAVAEGFHSVIPSLDATHLRWMRAALLAALPHMQPADWPPCPECGAGVLFECPACSASNYPEQPADEAMVKRACNAYDLAANPSSDPAEYPAMHAALRVALMSMMI